MDSSDETQPSSGSGTAAVVGGLASLAAGAIHLAVAGVHAEHPTLSRLFIVAGLAQILIGAWAMVRRSRVSLLGVALVNVIAVGAWAVSRITSVGWIDGLAEREPVGRVDLLCAILGALALASALWSRRGAPSFTVKTRPLTVAAVAIAVLAAPALWSSTSHSHDGEAHENVVAGSADTGPAHDDGDHPATTATANGHTETTHDHAATTHDHEPAPVAKPYDPTQPIDLGGVDGVTPEQQAAAENIVAETLIRLPQWADYRVAEAAGFRSIGDALTGAEHFVQWSWIDDDVILNPNFPESLVYEPQADGSKKLVSAMYMLSPSVALEDVPDIGGSLMQWHIHDNLCFTTDAEGPKVRGLTDATGNCPPKLEKFPPAAMIHVWIVPHKCGPFAALEGIGAGQVLDGTDHACDAAHGSH